MTSYGVVGRVIRYSSLQAISFVSLVIKKERRMLVSLSVISCIQSLSPLAQSSPANVVREIEERKNQTQSTGHLFSIAEWQSKQLSVHGNVDSRCHSFRCFEDYRNLLDSNSLDCLV